MIVMEKKDGTATVPLLGMLLVISIIFTILYISYVESQKINERTDDAVTISIQGACLFDRYEFSSCSQIGKNVVCFFSGDLSLRYSDFDHDYNMEITKQACEYAYELYENVLIQNLSTRYVILPDENSGGVRSCVKKFEMVNVRNGVAYVYDCVSGSTTFLMSATDMKSTLEVTMEMDMDFPIYGVQSITFNETGKLEYRIR